MDIRNKIFVVVGTVAVLATAGVTGLSLYSQQDSTGSTTTSQTSVSSSDSTSNQASTDTSSNSTSTTTGSYKDGTYTASVSYSVPRNDQNSIKVTVVVSSGKISSVDTTNTYADRESGEYISRFESSVNGKTVGQSLSNTSFSRIGGASLTTSAFTSALEQIATKAQAA